MRKGKKRVQNAGRLEPEKAKERGRAKRAGPKAGIAIRSGERADSRGGRGRGAPPGE